jgi:hypothetical protein
MNMAIDQRQLNPELTEWLENRQKQLQIVKTTRTPSGQILDWIPIESQFPDGKVPSPPPPHLITRPIQDKDRPIKPAQFELDDPAVERGPQGTVPIPRPDISRLTRRVSLNDYLRKRGPRGGDKNSHSAGPLDPSTSYFHAISSQTTTSYGCAGTLNVWDPVINNPSSDGADHSILQTWVQSRGGKTLESVEMGWTVDNSLNGDTQPHVFTYYTNNGYAKNGNNLGGYNQLVDGWKQISNSAYPGARINGISTQDGTQFGISIQVLFFGGWFYAIQGVLMGYYPAALFSGELSKNASWVGFGGEVATDLAKPASTKDQMGSGRNADDGWQKSACLINLQIQSDPIGTMVNNNGSAETDSPAGVANPYTVKMEMNSGTSWGSYCWVGGPAK